MNYGNIELYEQRRIQCRDTEEIDARYYIMAIQVHFWHHWARIELNGENELSFHSRDLLRNGFTAGENGWEQCI